MLVADRMQIAPKLGALVWIETGGGLIEAEKDRLRAHRARDLETALGAIGQLASRIVGALGQTDFVEPIARLVDGGALRPRIGAKPERAKHRESGGAHQRIVLSNQKIFQNRHAWEQPNVLECARDPCFLHHQIIRHALEQEQRSGPAADAARAALGQSLELLPRLWIAELQRNASFGGLVEAGDAVEHRSFTGAVRAYQRGYVTTSNGERQIVDGNQAAEAHIEIVDAQYGR